MTNKLMAMFRQHLKTTHEIELYQYQLEVAEKIFNALIKNLRLTSQATEEQIKDLKQEEIGIEFSRQAGKTTTIVHVIEFIMIFFPNIFDRTVAIGIFAPQREQAKTDFDRLKTALNKSTELQVTTDKQADEAREESNAKTIVIPNGSSCYIFPVTPTSKPESKTLDLIVFEEAQDLSDKIIKEQIWPMGKFTNAPRIYIGTAGTSICYYYRLIQAGNALILDYEKISVQRRDLYKTSNNPIHLMYEQSVKSDIEQFGRESDEVRRPYFLEWLIGTGQFTTMEQLAEVETDRKPTFHDKHSDCYAGIDTAKHPDSTVVTVIRWNKDLGKKELINWLELRGENYQDQYDVISEFLKNYNIIALAIDSTGQGDFMPDMFERHSIWQDENTGLYRLKFSAVSKDIIYKNLKVSIQELLTTLPKLSTKVGERFKQQMLDLQQEHKGQLLSVHHPDDPNAHDDFPDSWALAEYAFAQYTNTHNAEAHFITSEEEKRGTVYKEKDERGKERVTDYWPGLD